MKSKLAIPVSSYFYSGVARNSSRKRTCPGSVHNKRSVSDDSCSVQVNRYVVALVLMSNAGNTLLEIG